MSDDEADLWDFVHRYDRGAEVILKGFLSARVGARMVWPVVKAARLKRIWLDFGKSGVVRDEKGMAEIVAHLLDNIAMLRVSTELCGHSQIPAESVIEAAGYDLTDEQIDQLGDYLTHHDDSWLLSDYGLPKLEELYGPLFRAESAEEQLLAADRVLNVCYQRSDLASLFVEGGTKTLNEIFDQGGYYEEAA